MLFFFFKHKTAYEMRISDWSSGVLFRSVERIESMPHILIVEDETIIRSALRRLLERNQYQVSEAGSVQEAQERFSIPTFDLIVSDLRLPGTPVTELTKIGQGTPVLIMTSYASMRSTGSAHI